MQIKLNQKNLSDLPKEVKRPTYNRSEVRTGIVHIGVGGFHRAHQAFYTDELLSGGGNKEWGICGVALLPQDQKIYKVLEKQDGLYTLMVHQRARKTSARVIGSITEFLFAPEEPERVILKIADPEVKIVTLTITEGGYNLDSSTGEFQKDNPKIQYDLKHPNHPQTVFGYLTQALKLRKEKDLPLTIQSCDNIQQNGEMAGRMLLSYIRMAEPELEEWIKENVRFPNSMVDRITPVTTEEDIEKLQKDFQTEDEWPVVSEDFYQWIIEDDFIAERPPWDKVGVQFVKDVAPYEKMKLRLLNGGHSLVGLSGSLAGYPFINEAMEDPLIRDLLLHYLDHEVTPLLDELPGIDLKDYKSTILHRFANPHIKDSVERIIGQSSAKLPKFILPVLSENLQKGRPDPIGALVIAAWYIYLKRSVEDGNQIQDEMKDLLIKKIKASAHKGPEYFLSLYSIFGNLNQSELFIQYYKNRIEEIRERGIEETIKSILKQ